MLTGTSLTLLVASSLVGAAVLPRAAPTVPIIEMTYPPTRGEPTIETDSIAPCQGYAIGGRYNYPISSGADIALNQTRDAKEVQISYSTLANPQTLADFKPLLANVSQVYRGSSCFKQPDFAALGLKVGDEITIKLEYYSGPSKTNCADLKLVEDSAYSAGQHYCANVTETTQTRGNANPNINSTRSASAAASAATAAEAATASQQPTSGAESAIQIGGLGAAAFFLAAFAI